jgi:HSP20 family protein
MLTRWSPVAKRNGTALIPFEREFDRIFNEMERAFGDVSLPTVWWRSDSFVPAADVVETADAITIRLDMPGHEGKGIEVNVENDTLTVRSERKVETHEQDGTSHRTERRYGLYARSFELPAEVDAQKTEARYENGVLTITLPKREEAKPKSISVKVQ